MGRRRCAALATAVAWVFLRAAPALAIPPRVGVTQLVVDTWTTVEGLPQDRVQAIGQTGDGLIWVGTEAGLARFDGHRFVVFSSPSVPALRNQSITAVYGASNGALFVGTGAGFVIRIVAGRATTLAWPDGAGPHAVWDFREDEEGTLWVATGDGVYRSDGVRLLPAVPGIGSIFALDRLPDGTWFFGGRDGLFRWDGATLTHFTESEGFEWGRVSGLRAARDGTLWVALRSAGLVSYKDRRWRTFGSARDFVGNLARALVIDRDDQVWLGTWNGLGRVEGSGFSSWLTAAGRMPSAIEALFEDRDGAIWVGTMGGGLYRIQHGAVVTHTVDQGLPRDDVLAVCATPGGRVVAGVGDVGAAERGPSGWTRLQVSGEPGDAAVWACAADARGTMWFATGVGLFSRRDDRTERHRLPGLDPDTLVGSVAATANGDLWAVAEGRVYRRAHGENGWTRVAAEPGIDVVLGDAPEGGVWMGGDGGLFLWRGGSISRAWRGPDAAHRPVSLLVEPDGTAWVGTFAAGLLRYRAGEATLFGRAAGLPDLAIASVLDDGHGFFWLATHAGLVRVSKARLSSATDTTWLDPIAYTVRDGLRSHYTDERGQPAGVVTPDGHLWFGTTRGIVEIDPSRLPDRPRANGVYIDGVWADGRLLEADRVVPPGRGSLQFRFATAAHVSSSHVRFRYRLEGFDTGWTEVGGARDASYTNVPPGTYRFVVGAADETPDWGPDEMSVTLVLSPHWYQAWWVRGVATAGVLGLVVTLPLVRARKARRAAESLARIVDARTADLRGEVDERRRAEDDLRASEARYRTLAGELEDRVRDRTAALEAEVAERKRYEQELIVARDAAESGARAKSAFLASMSHELRTPLNAVIGYTEMLQEEAAQRGLASFEPDLARIRGAGQHLLALVSEVLDLARIEAGRVSLTPETFEVRELVTEVVDSVATTARRHGNSVHVDIEPGVDVMTADVLRLKQVLLNLLSNACKFTKDGAVTIEVRRSNEGNAAWTSFVVRDTGIGIAAEHLPRLFVEFTQVHGRGSVHEGAGLGLAISRRLCLLMAGTIEVASELGTGTAFTVRLPTRARVAESVVD